MQLIKKANGKNQLKMSRKEWESIGEKASWVVKNVECKECGDLIKIYHKEKEHETILCDKCKYPRVPEVGGGGSGHYHAEDDSYGASSSWDNAVKLHEIAQIDPLQPTDGVQNAPESQPKFLKKKKKKKIKEHVNIK